MDNLILWWRDLHFSPALKRSLLILSAAIVALSALFIFRSSAEGAPQIAPPLVIDSESEVSVTIDIEGAVLSPGVFTLSLGSRVIDAIKLAGGTTPEADLSDINQARVLVDGEQIYIYAKSSVSSTVKKSTVKTRPSGLISINRATAKEFESLKGIGNVLATRIVAYRKEHGSFATIEDLLKVPGIGEATLKKFKSRLRL